jgi:hypothetical protein
MYLFGGTTTAWLQAKKSAVPGPVARLVEMAAGTGTGVVQGQLRDSCPGSVLRHLATRTEDG